MRIARAVIAALVLFAALPVCADPAGPPRRNDAAASPSFPLVGGVTATAAASTAFDYVMTPSYALTCEETAQAKALLLEAAAANPDECRWPRALARIAAIEGQREEARRYAQKAVSLAPNIAANHYALGTAVFSGLETMGLGEKMNGAGEGKKAFLRAIELDPNMIEPRFGVAEFYVRAPGLVGGSNRKARDQAEVLLKMPDAACLGHVILAQIAADNEKWNDMEREFSLAREAAATDERRCEVVGFHATWLVRVKKDPVAALPVIDQYTALASPCDVNPRILKGQARQALKDFPAAIVQFQEALVLRPGSSTARFAIAECYAAIGDKSSAITHYQEFMTRFPDDDRAGDAKKAVKKLGKK